MKRFLVIISLFLVLPFLFPTKAKATVDPLSSPNNKFGIHILDANDIGDAKNLVNSSGGDWGYVTLVVREDERDINHYQEVFNALRKSHLIPIVRLATKQEDNGWQKFRVEDIQNWVYFLNSLNWITQNRYVIIGNEPNHADEWGKEVNPEEYTQTLCEFSSQLKSASNDFFVLSAGLDASAPDKKGYMDEATFITQMKASRDFSECIDGWVSHSYPNPNFSGSEKDTGKGTITTYKWEEAFLKSVGIKKDLPVFITETGWLNTSNSSALSKKYEYAFTSVWNDPKVVAVTPFVLNYKEPLFELFSWKDSEGKFYPFYDSVKALPKVKGEPVQKEDGEIVFMIFPKLSEEGVTMGGYIYIKNSGQAIWDSTYKIVIDNGFEKYEENKISTTLEPTKSHWQKVSIKLPNYEGSIRGGVYIEKNGKKIGRAYHFEILTIRKNSNIIEKIIQIKNYISGWFLQKANQYK